MKNILIVFGGGGLGSVCRYLLSKYFNLYITVFPLGTFIVNILGCFAIGLILSLSQKYMNFSASWILFLATGFCGGFTAFSSFSLKII